MKNGQNCNFGRNELWHYVALSQNTKKARKQLWHYVALCGTIPKTAKSSKTAKIAILEKKSCGTMWHYQKTPKTQENSCGTMWHYVALCGTMWRYVALSQKQLNNQKQQKLQFWKKRAVALCGTIKNHQKRKKTAVALCGAMWHYPKNS